MPLDEINHIRKIDKKDMLSHINALPQQIRDTLNAMKSVEIPDAYRDCKNIVTIGIGGSGIPGNYLRNIYRNECSVPIFVHKSYGLPRFVDSDTLILITSYSGTTEETLDAFRLAQERGAKIFGISSGDKLLDLLQQNNLPHYIPPAGRATRTCLGFLLFSMITVLEKLGYIASQETNVAATLELMDQQIKRYGFQVPLEDNEAKSLALKLHNKLPIIYSTIDSTEVVGLRWKHEINENSKQYALLEIFPDASHNHLAAVGKKPYGTCEIFLRSEQEEGADLKKRIDAVQKVFEKNTTEVVAIEAEGANTMTRFLSLGYFGDFVSFYLAMLNEVDPTPTTPMSELKGFLGLTDLSP